MGRDPFADDADEAQTETGWVWGHAEEQDEAPKAPKPASKPVRVVKTTKREPDMSENNDGKITVTLKGGAGFDAPWIVFYFDGVEDALDTLNGDAESVKALIDRTARISAVFTDTVGGSRPAASANNGGRGGKSGNGQDKPAYKKAPRRGGEAPVCDHGVAMDWKSGVSKAGKPYEGYFCAGTDDWDDQCKPVFKN
jgi:hypothetical protein